MDDLEAILLQIGKLLREWQKIESVLFYLYVLHERELSSHRLLATTFHHIRSFETKLSLVDKTLEDHLTHVQYHKWDKELRKPLSDASAIRNNIVHGELTHIEDGSIVIQPFMTDLRRHDGIAPSFSYDLAFLQTTELDWLNLSNQMLAFHIEVDPAPGTPRAPIV